MKGSIIATVIVILMTASTVSAGEIIGRHILYKDRGIVKVKSIAGNKMSIDIIYAPQKGKMIMLTDVFADYDPRTHQAVYSEDRFCPNALTIRFQSNGKVILHQAACAAF